MKKKFTRPLVKRPIIDRIEFVLPASDFMGKRESRTLRRVYVKVCGVIKAGRGSWSYAPSRYLFNFNLMLKSGVEVLVQIGAKDSLRQKGGIRITINPAKCLDGDIAHFYRMMRIIVGPEFDGLMLRPLINRLDVAVDIHYLELVNLLVRFKGAQQHSLFCQRIDTGGVITGCNMGSVNSDYADVVYGKDLERAHSAISAIGSTGTKNEALTANRIEQIVQAKNGPSIVRVEVRGKKLRGATLSQLPHLPNRFNRFQFADMSSAGQALPRWLERSFYAMCWQQGVKVALSSFKHSEYARFINSYWQNRQVSWWTPDSMWLQACDTLRNSGLFADEAFDD